MAVKFFYVDDFLKDLHRRFISKDSPALETQLDLFVADIVQSRASITNGFASVKFGPTTYTFRPTMIPLMSTADGGLATDATLLARQFLTSLVAPTIGVRASKDPRATAEYIRAFAMKFFTGGTVGGAILDTGRWYISPHWMPFPPPNPVEEVSASIEDPVSRTLHRWAAETADGENAKKGAAVAADPYFALLAIEGTTKVTTAAYTIKDLMALEWSVSLVHAGDDAEDVVTRPATLVTSGLDTTTPAHWMSDAYEEYMEKSGNVLALLQTPRTFMYNRILDRVAKDPDGTWWFRGFKTDYKLAVGNEAAIMAVRQDPTSFKLSYLDMIRGVPLGKPRLTTAFQGSALGGILGAYDFRSTANTSAFTPWDISSSRRAWLASDPNTPASLKWLIATPLTEISSAWLPVSTDDYVNNVLLKV